MNYSLSYEKFGRGRERERERGKFVKKDNDNEAALLS